MKEKHTVFILCFTIDFSERKSLLTMLQPAAMQPGDFWKCNRRRWDSEPGPSQQKLFFVCVLGEWGSKSLFYPTPGHCLPVSHCFCCQGSYLVLATQKKHWSFKENWCPGLVAFDSGGNAWILATRCQRTITNNKKPGYVQGPEFNPWHHINHPCSTMPVISALRSSRSSWV